METDIVFLHRENFNHQDLNYEIIFVDYSVNFKDLPAIRNMLYSTLFKYFKTDYLHLIQIPNTITFFCFPPPEGVNIWEPYGREFTNKIKDIEKRLSNG